MGKSGALLWIDSSVAFTFYSFSTFCVVLLLTTCEVRWVRLASFLLSSFDSCCTLLFFFSCNNSSWLAFSFVSIFFYLLLFSCLLLSMAFRTLPCYFLLFLFFFVLVAVIDSSAKATFFVCAFASASANSPYALGKLICAFLSGNDISCSFN